MPEIKNIFLMLISQKKPMVLKTMWYCNSDFWMDC
jgi:hypothetical protein